MKPDTLHILRNPHGWSEEKVREARLDAADNIEAQAAEILVLRGTVDLVTQVSQELKANLAELERDAVRYRWLERNAGTWQSWWKCIGSESFAMAIDAAMKEAK